MTLISLAVLDVASSSVAGEVELSGDPRGMVSSADGNIIYVACGPNKLVAINLHSGTVLSEIVVGGEPVDVVATSDGWRLYVSCEDANHVAVVDAPHNVFIGAIATGDAPEGMAIAPTNQKVYVSEGNDELLSVIDTARNLRKKTKIASIGSPTGVAVTGVPQLLSGESARICRLSWGNGCWPGDMSCH